MRVDATSFALYTIPAPSSIHPPVYSVEPNLEAVISYASSGLMFGDKFAGKEIKMFSLAGLCKKKIEKDAIEILQNAGVVFVN